MFNVLPITLESWSACVGGARAADHLSSPVCVCVWSMVLPEGRCGLWQLCESFNCYKYHGRGPFPVCACGSGRASGPPPGQSPGLSVFRSQPRSQDPGCRRQSECVLCCLLGGRKVLLGFLKVKLLKPPGRNPGASGAVYNICFSGLSTLRIQCDQELRWSRECRYSL